MRSQRNSLKYNVHYRGKNSIAGSQEDIVVTICPFCSLTAPAHSAKMCLLCPGACLVFWGPSASVPGGAPSVDFAIDSGVGKGIVYILSILIRYLSIQLSILLSIIWCKNKLCKKMLKISSYFITAIYKCLQANRKRHIKHIF